MTDAISKITMGSAQGTLVKVVLWPARTHALTRSTVEAHNSQLGEFTVVVCAPSPPPQRLTMHLNTIRSLSNSETPPIPKA